MAEDGHHCLFMEEKAINAWEMQAPMLIILVFNTFFLVWVISVYRVLYMNLSLYCIFHPHLLTPSYSFGSSLYVGIITMLT